MFYVCHIQLGFDVELYLVAALLVKQIFILQRYVIGEAYVNNDAFRDGGNRKKKIIMLKLPLAIEWTRCTHAMNDIHFFAS